MGSEDLDLDHVVVVISRNYGFTTEITRNV
jgi:hypothetical protein